MTSWRRTLALLLTVGLAASGFSLPAAAQSNGDSGIISITVHDASGPKPLGDARVFLMGPTTASALTTASGIVKYTDVPSGIYRVRVTKAGFQGAASAQFEVLGNKQVDVTVSLASAAAPTASAATSTTASGLRIIGRVQATVSVSTKDVDENSAIRKISDSLADALNTIAGVDVTQDSNDPDAPQTISLRGMDESQTAVTLDGIPLSAPGAATNLRGMGTDLFTGAGASFGPQAGALAGSVNFRTLQPTQSWQSRLSTGYGTFDRFNYQVGETGSFGRLGIALLHTGRQSNNPLTFNTYTDASGLSYAHAGEAASSGDFLKLRYSVGDRTTVNLTGLQNQQATAQLCTQFVTLVPCGIGPGNVTTGKFQFGYASVATLVGDVSISITGYANHNASFLADDNRLIAGVASPYSSRNETLARGVALAATVAHGKHTFTLTGSTYASTTNFTPVDTAGLSAFVLASTNASASRVVQLADSFKSNDKLTLGANLSVAGTSGAGSSLVGGLNAGWRPTSTDSFSAGISLGSSQPAAGIVRSLSDPSSARVNCAAQTASVSGPGDQNGPQSSLSFQASWQHQWRTASLSADLYRQSQNGQLINALLTGASAGLPAGYVAQIDQYYQLATVCGAGSALPNIYVNEFIGNTARVYQGFSLSGRIGLGKNALAIPSYTTASAIVTSANPLLLTASSTTIVGAQIPGRPLHKGNLTFDVNEPHSGTEFLANVSYVGSGNAQHLAPYSLVNLGLSHQAGIGRLTFFVSNLFNTEAGTFSTLAYAEPLALSGGGYLLTAANPNPPRQYTVTYSFNTGALKGAGSARGRAAAGAGARAVAAAPGGSPAPGAPNQLRGRFTFEPPPPGTDPLAPATNREACTADFQTKAQPLVAALRAAAAAYRAGTAPANIGDFAVTGHGDPKGDSWYLSLRPNFGAGRPGGPGGPGGQAGRPPGGGPGPGGGGEPGEGGGFFGGPPPIPAGNPVVVVPRSGASPQPRPSVPPEVRERLETFRAFLSCAYVTALKPADAKAKGIDMAGPGFGYAPAVGMFFVQPPELGSGGGSVR